MSGGVYKYNIHSIISEEDLRIGPSIKVRKFARYYLVQSTHVIYILACLNFVNTEPLTQTH
jgi:hypothetical protein